MQSRDIKDLAAEMQPLALAFLEQAAKVLPANVECRMIQTGRSAAYQNQLYAQGRTAPGKKVTNATSKDSAHCVDRPETETLDSLAFDIGLFRDGKYLDGSKPADVELYKAIGPVGRELGLRWGGDFKSITDLPHYEHMSWQNRKR